MSNDSPFFWNYEKLLLFFVLIYDDNLGDFIMQLFFF